MKKKLISVLLGITLVVSNCSYVGAVDIGDSAVEVPDFSDEVQEDELFSDGSEEVPETEDETVHPAATTEKVKVGIKGSYLGHPRQSLTGSIRSAGRHMKKECRIRGIHLRNLPWLIMCP